MNSQSPASSAAPASAGSPDRLASRQCPAAEARVRQRLLAAKESPWLNEEVARRMAERLSWFRRSPASVLVWPGDDGPLPDALRQACPTASWHRVVEHRQPASSGWWQRLTQSANVPELPPQALSPVDMLWSVMRLHLDSNPQALLKAWRQALAAEGFVLYATLGSGSLPELRGLYQRQGWGEAWSPVIDMHDLGDMMVEAGFADPVLDQESITLTFASPQALLAELRGLGANTSPARFPGLRGRQWRQALEAGLKSLAGPDGRIPLTLEVVYGHAFRAPDKGPQVAAETRVDLQDMAAMLKRRRPT